MSDDRRSRFWQNIIRAAEAEPRDARVLRGASGFSHPIVAIGVDQPRRRVVIVSGEGDARAASMAQGDIQATLPYVNVVMVRPVALNMGLAARLITEALGRVKFGRSDLRWFREHPDLEEHVRPVLDPLFEQLRRVAMPSISVVPLNLMGVAKDVIQQLSLVETQPDEPSGDEDELSIKVPTFDLSTLAVLDPVEADRGMGVCSIPLYELAPEEVEALNSRSNDEQAREILRRHDVLQYFFPAADQLALGLLDREPVSSTEILSRLTDTPKLGHPYGELELIDRHATLNEVVAALQEQGLLVEGEAAVEVTPEGRSVRSTVTFKPREGLISKLLQRFSIKVDLSLKDLY